MFEDEWQNNRILILYLIINVVGTSLIKLKLYRLRF